MGVRQVARHARRSRCAWFGLVAAVAVVVSSCATSSGTWTVTAPPTTGGRVVGPSVYRVSCDGATRCVALGTATVTSGTTTSTGEGEMAWDGTSWRTIPPSGVDAYSIDCFAGGCLALGQDDKAIWNGTTWTRTAGAGAIVDSCAAIDDCYQISTDGMGHQVLQRWTGTTGTSVTDVRTSTRVLTAIDCPVPGTCTFGTAWQFGDPHVMERWSQGSWTVEALDAAFIPADISCASATACVAVGRDDSGAAAAVRQGAGWHVVPLAGAGALDAVDCTSATRCVAYGRASSAFVFDGTVWTATATPGAPPADADRFAIGCATATLCFAVGGNSYLQPPRPAYIERWNGTGWSDAPVTGATVSDAGFEDVSCTTATECLAVGTYQDGSTTKLLAERWDGSAWTLLADPPLPAGATIGPGADVVIDCGGARSCIAATTATIGGAPTPVAVRWNGSGWEATALAAPAHAGAARVVDVSCASATSCVLVGDQTVGLAATRDQFAQRWNGATWAAVASPLPSPGNQTPASVVPQLSCPTTTFCALANPWTTPNVTLGTTVERFDGTSWTSMPTLPPVGSGQQAPALVSLDCDSATSCVGAGFVPGGAHFVRWDGTTWHDQTPFLSFVLATVSCVPDGRCLAVGAGVNPPAPGASIGGYSLAGAGSSWAGTTAPGSAAARTVSGVSCAATGTTTSCLVVGRSTTGAVAVPHALRFQF